MQPADEFDISVQLYDFKKQKDFEKDVSKANLFISIEGDMISVHINADNIFSTLFFRDEIVGVLNKKCYELVQKHLDQQRKLEAGK